MTKEVHCPECGCCIDGDTMSADPMRRRFFAALRDTHSNLRDEHLQRFPNPEVLRKHALIAVGWCDTHTIVCGSKTAAAGIAAYLKMRDQYCIITVAGDILTIYTARSMARRVLLKKQFIDVAQKAFDWIYKTTGVDPDQALEGRAA